MSLVVLLLQTYPVGIVAMLPDPTKQAEQQPCLDQLMSIYGWAQGGNQLPQLIALVSLYSSSSTAHQSLQHMG
jgi:hypothetical protein